MVSGLVGVLARRVVQRLFRHHGFDGLIDAIIAADAREVPFHHLGDGIFVVLVIASAAAGP